MVLSTSTSCILVPAVSHYRPLTPQETLQDQQVGLVQGPVKSLIFPLGPGVHEILCVPSMTSVSVSPNPVEFLIKPHWPSKPNVLGAPPPDARTPDWRA